ncbi:MAG: phosphate signaling complex protein PhoU [Nevskia sp.]|nr:phosphate signaling complex protein PhoU [Nevskia sp.]
MTDHTLKAFDQELHELTGLVVQMGGLTEKQIHGAMQALVRRDEHLAHSVVAADEEVDALERRIEDLAIQLIAKRAPLAGDLREIVAALRISIDLERVGDFAKNISRRFAALRSERDPNHLMRRVEQMAELALEQVRKVLDSYVRRDAAEAIAVWRHDDAIDAIYTSLFRELLTYMMEDPRNITFSTHLLFCAKYVERIGDHATNIAETVYFMIKGELPQGARPRGDMSEADLAAV